MDTGLRGLHALITGASGGIGSAIVRVLADEGTNLTLHRWIELMLSKSHIS